MVIKVATVGMVFCSLLILGIVFALGHKSSPPAPVTTPASAGASSYTGPVPREIAWEHSLQSALNSAANGNRMVVVDVYTDWCGWCKRMDRDIYSDPQVAALGREAVFLKLNAEDQSEGQRFAREHGVRGFPTTIILDSRGNALQKEAGYISPASTFVEWIHRARS